MPSERPYSRVYWSVLDDPKFETILPNERHLGTWMKLLIVADMAWPAPAYLPPVPRPSVSALVAAGLVDLLSGGRYRIRGLEAERSRRSASASVGASSRWSGRNANALLTHTERSPNGVQSESVGNAVGMPRREEDETRQGEDELRAPDAAASLYQRTGDYPSVKVLEWLNDLAKEAGGGDVDAGEVRVAALIDATPLTGNRRDYLARIRDLIRAENHAAERQESADERARLAEKRAKPTPLRPAPVDQTEEEADAELRAYFAKGTA